MSQGNASSRKLGLPPSVMKGFVQTPSDTVDFMVDQLFRHASPRREQTILDPGAGLGAFIDGVIRWCKRHKVQLPEIRGVETDPHLAAMARTRFKDYASIEILSEDFLLTAPVQYDFVIGNPPYVPITALSDAERQQYRRLYESAKGRFDLYLLFFEQALKSLQPSGRLVFITPEKFLYVETAAPLRRLLSNRRIEEIHLVHEGIFGGLVTYPTITTVSNLAPVTTTRIIARDGSVTQASLPSSGVSWQAVLHGDGTKSSGPTLEDICTRVSCGIATGADAVFVLRTEDMDPHLRRFAYPTIAGRELKPLAKDFDSRNSMLVPYSPMGELLSEEELGPLRTYLLNPSRHAQLMKRTCVLHKPWFAFHETPPLYYLLSPKILCKDISARPHFWIDASGKLLPRHSVYYIVPRVPDRIDELCSYLNSETAQAWFASHCQRASNGFLRLQSHVLKQLPVPSYLADEAMFQMQINRENRTVRGRKSVALKQMNLPLRARDAHSV